MLRELIEESQTSPYIFSFATHRLHDVFTSVEAAAARGVSIVMVLETAEDSGGELTFDDIARYKAVSGLELFVWPKEKRPAFIAILAPKGGLGPIRRMPVDASLRQPFIVA